MEIRSARETDFEPMWSIFKKVIEPGTTYVFAANTSRDDAFEYWFGKGVTSFVAEDQGHVVGMYKIVANQRDLGSHVANASFMVDPSCHGKGLGQALGRHCLSRAKAAGYLAMQFNCVVSTNEPAVALWKKLGFAVIGVSPRAFRHPSLGYVDLLIMHCFL
jgi:L-amino acid N-acyltransferase YncA